MRLVVKYSKEPIVQNNQKKFIEEHNEFKISITNIKKISGKTEGV